MFASRLTALVLIAALALVAGCSPEGSSDVDAANAAIDAANAQVEVYNALDLEITQLMDEAMGAEATAEGAAQALDLLDQVDAKLNERIAAVNAARDSLASIQGMDVAEEMKTYAGKEIAIIDKMVAADQVLLEMVAELRSLYAMDVDGEYDEAAVTEVNERLLDLSDELAALDEEIAALQNEADAYYESSGIAGE
ncbi:MAG: hypothetical protein Kow0067_18130 [Coriobacteriia bacterium]